MRHVEIAEGPLLPRWASTLIHAVFIPWCIFAAVWIGYAMVVQDQTMELLGRIKGPWEGDVPPMDSPHITEGIDFLQQKPRQSLLYVIQELLREEIDDPRMARAIALRKATNWAVESRRRHLFEEILQHMSEDGEMPPVYELPEQHQRTLDDLLKERLADPTRSYEERKITEVVQWLAGGRQTVPKGPERRRIKSLQSKYQKRLFFGEEKETLTMIAEDWSDSTNAARRGAAEKFLLMLDGQHAELTPEEREECLQTARHWEALYLKGRERLSEVAFALVQHVESEDTFLDHPEIWDMVRLLHEPYAPARRNMAEIVYVLRNRKYVFIYLSEFIKKDTINPVMAVETARLTKDEHEQLLRRQNHTRRLAAIEVVERIATDYCRNPFEMENLQEGQDQDKIFKEKTIQTLESVLEDEDVGSQAQQALKSIREACPQYFD